MDVVGRRRDGPMAQARRIPGALEVPGRVWAFLQRGNAVAEEMSNDGGSGNFFLAKKSEARHDRRELFILQTDTSPSVQIHGTLRRLLQLSISFWHPDQEPVIPPLFPSGFGFHEGEGPLDVRTEAERDAASHPALAPNARVEEVAEQRHGWHHPDERLAGVGEDRQVKDGAWRQMQELQLVRAQDLHEEIR